MLGRRGYTRTYKKEGIRFKLTLHFTKKRIKKLNKLRRKDDCTVLSMASVVEKIVNNKLSRVKL